MDIRYSEKAEKKIKKIYKGNKKLGTGRRHIMIKTQLLKQDNKPVAVVLDYKEYLRLKEIEEDRNDYYAALDVKIKNGNHTPI